MAEVKIIGYMDWTMDHTFESANRVYDQDGLCPTIPTGAGGGHLPKVIWRLYETETGKNGSKNND